LLHSLANLKHCSLFLRYVVSTCISLLSSFSSVFYLDRFFCEVSTQAFCLFFVSHLSSECIITSYFLDGSSLSGLHFANIFSKSMA
jgi:hypothetical protein